MRIIPCYSTRQDCSCRPCQSVRLISAITTVLTLDDTHIVKSIITATQDSWSCARVEYCTWSVHHCLLSAYLPLCHARFGLTVALKNRGALQLQGHQPGALAAASHCTDYSRTGGVVWVCIPRKAVLYDISTTPPCNSLDENVTSVLPNSSATSV
jgi:hypothetical protein